jgi:hypothetical protein
MEMGAWGGVGKARRHGGGVVGVGKRGRLTILKRAVELGLGLDLLAVTERGKWCWEVDQESGYM